MAKHPAILILLIALLHCTNICGQVSPNVPPVSNLRHKQIHVSDKPVLLDSLSIIPNSFQIVQVDSSAYLLDYVNAILYWKKKPADSVIHITYRVFPMRLNAQAQRINFDSLVMNTAAPIAAATADDQQRNLFNFGNLDVQGSFGRQVGFGNNQSAVLNSNLNVQINGMLADSIQVQAAITDNNIPIQPDGNTQQLNQFDEVYIRFKKKGWQLNVGDMDMRENRSYFLNFYKRLQGIAFQTENKIGKNARSGTIVSGSVAKGKFTRNVLQGLEGNQGPYRLTGANNETFFIVLANTERVYIDGVLLQRGEDQDYVINYNTAEVTFTPRRMITKDSRIQIEFEYGDRNFLNMNVFAMQELEFNKKVKLRVGYFNNSDAKNSSINQVLDPRQRQFLARLGDSIQNAYYPNAAVDTFAAGKVLYERIYDSVNNVVVDSFYRYSVDQHATLYNVGFADVGFGRGDYILDANGANGKVYTYVRPVNGVHQGNYLPVTLLVTPKKQELMNLGIDYQLSKNTIIKTELAASNYNVNTFSRLSAGDNKGYAAKINITNAIPLQQKNNLRLITGFDYEYVQQQFKPLERLRGVEFTRDWGLPLVTTPATENIIKATMGLVNDKSNNVQYKFTSYTRSDDYRGFQHALTQATNWKDWVMHNDFTLTNYNAAAYKGYFLRPVIDISKKLNNFYNWRFGFRYTLERNDNRNKPADTLTFNAFSFNTYAVFLKSDETKKNRYGVTFYTRSDEYPVFKNFVRGDRSYNLNLQAELLSNTKRQFYLNSTFRKLKVLDPAVSRQQEDNTVLTRLEYTMNEWDGLLNGNVLYEVGAGQEQKREYAYFEVPPGTGQYAWIDYNNDGVQQLNEFELAAFPDQAKFIRIFTPTNQYIKANYTTLNYNLNIAPRMLWHDKNEKFISRFMLTTSLQITRKAQARGLFEFNPFKYGLTDTNLITTTNVWVNTLSFNRYSTVWGMDISNIRNGNKALLTYGYETRRLDDWTLKYRHNISKAVTLNITGIAGHNVLLTDDAQFGNKNYDIDHKSIEPALTFLRATTFRVMGGYKYEIKNNAPGYGGEKAVSNAFITETKYNILQSSAITAKFTYQSIHYNSAQTNPTTVSYIMLDGLLPGKNLLWNIMLTKRLMNNLELNFQYDGRKPGNTRVIHNGRASVTAIF